MAGKSDAERRAEIVGDDARGINGSLKSIMGARVSAGEGIEVQRQARLFLRNNPRVIGKLHIGRLDRPADDKPARNAIRAAMLLAWMHYPGVTAHREHRTDAEEYAKQIKEWFRNKQRAEIEQGVVHMWKNLIEYTANGYYSRRNNPALKQNFLNNNTIEFLKYYALGPSGIVFIPPAALVMGGEGFSTRAIADPDRIKGLHLHRQQGISYRLRLGEYQGPPPAPAHLQNYYWLPWRNRYITSIRLPANPVGPNPPTLFFTAFLQGCSVFIERRPPNNDVFVHHAGIEGEIRPNLEMYLPANGVDPSTRAALRGSDSVTFWRGFFLDFIRVPAHVARNMNNVVEVNRSHYIGTQFLQTFENRMRNILIHRGIRVQDLNRLVVVGTACVMGIRVGASWSFYLQENVALAYPVSRNRQIQSTLPLRVSRVYPNPAVLWDGTLQKLPGAIADPDIEY